MKMQTLALFFLAAAADRRPRLGLRLSDPVGRDGKPRSARRASRATEPVPARGARRAENAPRAGRGHRSRSSNAKNSKQEASPLAMRIAQAGLTWSNRTVLSDLGRPRRLVLRWSCCSALGLLAGARLRVRRRLRPAVLDARLSQEAARKQFPATHFPTPSTSSCAASRPACRCSTA